MTVSGNCELALRRFLKKRRGDPPLLPLWVDSICIHQADIEERNAQVAMMGDIYSKASYVLVWLRPAFQGADSSFEYAMKRFKESWQMRQMGSWHLRQSYLPRKLRSSYATSLEAWEAARSLEGNTSRITQSLRDLVHNSWFSRVWTIQEVARAQNAVAFCGEAVRPFKELIAVASSNLEANISNRTELHYYMREVVESYGQDGKKSLLWIISNVTNCGATEPKDKIFAIRELLLDFCVILPPPNYASTLGTVYLEVMTVILKQRSNILYMAGNTYASDLDCPSWVPDFRDVDLPHPFEDIIRSKHIQDATRRLVIDESHFPIDRQSLKLRGMILDHIDDCSPLELWHPGKSAPITEGVLERMREDHSEEVLGTLQAWVRMAVGVITGDMSGSWQKSLVDTITGFRYNQHNSIADMDTYKEAAKSWCAAVILSDINHKSTMDNDTVLWSAIDKVKYHSCEDLKPTLQRIRTSKDPQDSDYQTVLQFLQILGGDLRSVMLYTRKRRFFVTKNKHMGIGPISMKKGDMMVKITGLDHPFLLRETASKGHYQLIGDIHAPSLVTVNTMIAGTPTESYFQSDLKKVEKDSAHAIRIQRVLHQMNSEGIEAEAARVAGGEFVEEDIVIV